MFQLILVDCWFCCFFFFLLVLQFCEDFIQVEQLLFVKVSVGEVVVQFWQVLQGLVVLGSYCQFMDLLVVSVYFVVCGWLVWFCCFGGGLVFQGLGIINFSFVWLVQQLFGEVVELIYYLLCVVLQCIFVCFGVVSYVWVVSGFFCDGWYNFVCGEGVEVCKIVGIVQYWWLLVVGGGYVVLVYVVIFIDVDLSVVYQVVNVFEVQFGSEWVYCVDKIVIFVQLFFGECYLLFCFSEVLVQELDVFC